MKRELLEVSGIDTTGVTFVAADFEEDDWLMLLVEAGFDLERPALFLWEGVTMYLDPEAVEETLKKVASVARRSIVAFDYFTMEALTSRSLYWRYARTATDLIREPLKFGVDSTPPSRERLVDLLQRCGLSLVEQRTLGQEIAEKRAWGGFTIAGVQ